MREFLVDELGEEPAERRLEGKRASAALPELDTFPAFVVEQFLSFIPVRIFTRPWRKSLDDQQGREELFAELEKAYVRQRSDRSYYVGKNLAVFAPAED